MQNQNIYIPFLTHFTQNLQTILLTVTQFTQLYM